MPPLNFASHEGAEDNFSYHASVSLDNTFNMHILTPSDAQGMMILLISPHFKVLLHAPYFRRGSLTISGGPLSMSCSMLQEGVKTIQKKHHLLCNLCFKILTTQGCLLFSLKVKLS